MLEESLLHVFPPLDVGWRRPLISPASQPTGMSVGDFLHCVKGMHLPLEHFSLLCICLDHKNLQMNMNICVHL